MKTREKEKRASQLRDMLIPLENLVVNREKPIRDMRKMLEMVEGRIDEFDLMREQPRDFVLKSLNSNVEKMQGVLNFTSGKLTKRNYALEAMMMDLKGETMATMRALNSNIEELKGELVLFRAALGRGVLEATLNQEIDVLKLKEFAETRSASDVDNFLWEWSNTFVPKASRTMLLRQILLLCISLMLLFYGGDVRPQMREMVEP